ncbi:hypothetical protein AVEN_2858-1 [Araneus ventricosus]|uniref:Uncharacterized protein n=1 Tax=Araneus ventricosus TaxID=182803 RepID=A0A4Y2DW84_ARAVE|nr:hypothetical protein AVEN_2858-1 [Araneus ventricosus]
MSYFHAISTLTEPPLGNWLRPVLTCSERDAAVAHSYDLSTMTSFTELLGRRLYLTSVVECLPIDAVRKFEEGWKGSGVALVI